MFHVEWPNHLTHNRFVASGYLMVDFFFVLSGFVIAFNYIGRICDALSLGRFVWLRFWRLASVARLRCRCWCSLFIEVLKYLAQRHYGVVGNEEAFSRDNGWSLLLQLVMAHAPFPSSFLSFNNVSWSIRPGFYNLPRSSQLTVLTRRPAWLAVLIAVGGALATALPSTISSSRSSPAARTASFAGVIVAQLYDRLKDRVALAPRGRGNSVPPLAFLLVVAAMLRLVFNPALDRCRWHLRS